MGSPCDFCAEEGWYSKVVHGLSLSHLKISILECEPFSSINLNFQKNIIWCKLKWFYLFLKEFKESKYLNALQNFLLTIHSIELWKFSNKKNIVSKSLFKRIFFPQPSFKKGLQKFIKSLPNWIQSPATIHFLFFVSMKVSLSKNDRWDRKLS
jgi:hypothetical protein